jgi:HlyD family secretion protein
VWAIAAIVLVVLAIVIVRASHPDVTVRTATVDRQNLISSISTNGKVEPTNDFQAHAPAPGQIQRLFVSLNQHVRKGQELLQLDASDAASRVASAQAGVTAAQTNLQNMEKGGSQDELLAQRADLITAQQQQQAAAADLNTREALLAKGDASPAEVAQARQRLSDLAAKVAQIRSRETSRYSSADLAATRAQVSQNRAALSAAESSYSGVDIHSPISGTVYSLPVAQYDYVQGGEALIDVADLTRLQVRAYFDEPEIGKLADGQAVTIKWDAKPDRLWHGHILQAPTTVTTYGTRNVGECLITVDDANGDLLPNTNVTVTVTTSQRFNVLSLPREALHTQGATNFVYKVVDGKLVRTPVQVGVVNLTRVEITSGLNQGDTIALGATTETDLTDGLKVKTQPQQ